MCVCGLISNYSAVLYIFGQQFWALIFTSSSRPQVTRKLKIRGLPFMWCTADNDWWWPMQNISLWFIVSMPVNVKSFSGMQQEKCDTGSITNSSFWKLYPPAWAIFQNKNLQNWQKVQFSGLRICFDVLNWEIQLYVESQQTEKSVNIVN